MTYQHRSPSEYQHRSPFTYRDPVNAQAPFTYQHRSPLTYQHRSPFEYQHRSPSEYQHRSPFTYRDPSNAQAPFTYQHRSPFTYRNPVAYQNPFTYNHRSPFTYRDPRAYRNPFTYNHRSPFTYRNPVNGQEPNIRSAQQPAGYRLPVSAQQPNIRSAQEPNIRSAQQPNIRNNQEPNIRNGQEPNIRDTQSTYSFQNATRSSVNYSFQNPISFPGGGGGGGGCFAPGTLVWLSDGSHAPIENCVVGQYVMTWNESSKLIEPKPIVHTMVPRIESIFDVELSDGRILQITNSHPIMLANGEWGAFDVEKCVREHEWMEGVNSHELKVGDNIFSMTDAIMFDRADEVGLEIVSINENQEMTVYNLSRIEDNHTFFANGMLVHNFEQQQITPGFKP